VTTIASDQGRVARNGGSVALRRRLVVLWDEIHRLHADIDFLWAMYDRAVAKEARQ
jgi:hypothetical protein